MEPLPLPRDYFYCYAVLEGEVKFQKLKQKQEVVVEEVVIAEVVVVVVVVVFVINASQSSCHQ